MDSQQASSIKAALLLSRALCSHIEGTPFLLAENGALYDEITGLIMYDGHILSSMDMSRGALVLLRALVDDFAGAVQLDPQEVGRILELSVSLQDVMTEAQHRVDGTM